MYKTKVEEVQVGVKETKKTTRNKDIPDKDRDIKVIKEIKAIKGVKAIKGIKAIKAIKAIKVIKETKGPIGEGQ